jgi:hypothetical protein
MSAKMNKRVAKAVNASTKALEAELTTKSKRVSNSYSVDAGRDVQTDLTPWQKAALGNQEQFAIRNGFRRRHPNHLLNQFAAIVKTNKNPKLKYEEYIEAENERTELPEYAKKARRNDMVANQIGLVQTAVENYAKSKEKLSAMTAVGV